MAKPRPAHPDEEILERYVMGRLEEPALGAFEEHLMLCELCQQRTDDATVYVSVLKETLATAPAPAPEKHWREWLTLRWLPVPAPALAGALAVLLAVLVWQPWHAASPAEWRTVELQTMRGGETRGPASEGYSLQLLLDVSGLDATGAVAQIVTGEGKPVAEVPVRPAGNKVEAQYAPGLAAGQYWVRLTKSGDVLREYSLLVQRR